MSKDELPDNSLLYQMIVLHETYHKIESQLQHLKQITTLNNDVSKKLQTYFDLKDTDIVSMFYKFVAISFDLINK